MYPPAVIKAFPRGAACSTYRIVREDDESRMRCASGFSSLIVRSDGRTTGDWCGVVVQESTIMYR